MKNSIIRRLSVLMVALSLFVSFRSIASLPSKIAIHFDASGVANGFASIGNYRLVLTYFFITCAVLIFVGAAVSIFKRGNFSWLINYLYLQGAALSLFIAGLNFVIVKSNELAEPCVYKYNALIGIVCTVVLVLPFVALCLFFKNREKNKISEEAKSKIYETNS